ncbi:hypothetical protein [Streptomyces sp. NPDC002825]|uniref:hypothetical protein n=1 Tax=Streptomyces sp. NPDC002825 TaxID=3154666 RepID=UPI00331B1DB5
MSTDVGRGGGKNASLGEMTKELGAAGMRVPRASRSPPRRNEELLASRGLRDCVEERTAGGPSEWAEDDLTAELWIVQVSGTGRREE